MSKVIGSLALFVLLVLGSPLVALGHVEGATTPAVPGAGHPQAVPHTAQGSPLAPGMAQVHGSPCDEVPASVLVPKGSRAGPDVTPKNISFNSTDFSWFGYSVGTVGRATSVEVYVMNIGDVNATNINVKIEIKDYYSNVIDSHTAVVADIGPGDSAPVIWPDWTPTVTQKVWASVTSNVANDADPTNNIWSFYGTGWFVDKWLDTADSESDWSGDLSPTKWHTTAKIEADPDPTAHSAPKAWFAGTETVVGSFYTANMNASLISRSVDLKRMIPTNPVFINFKYYGGTTLPSDDLRLYISIDNGASWIDTRTVITGATQSQGTFYWFYRNDNWVDINKDGTMQLNEYEIGMDISEYIGHDVRFKFTFRSGPTSTGLGYYLDDFIVYGFESDQEVAVTGIDDLGTTHLNETEAVGATFANLGVTQSPGFTARMKVYNVAGLMEQEDRDISAMAPGGSARATWDFAFKAEGDHWVDVEILPPAQGTDGSNYDNRQERRVHVSSGGAGVLLVDDDGGATNGGRLHFWGYDVDTDYALTSALEAHGLQFDVWHVLFNSEGPDYSVLKGYHTVIWSTGWDGTGRSIIGTLGPADRATLREYLGAGGGLWLISQETVYDLIVADPSFLRNTLHLSGYQDDAGFPTALDGVPGNVISNGWAFGGQVPVPGNDRTDSLSPASPAVGMTYESENIKNPSTGPFNGVNYNGSSKIVYTAFDITYLNKDKDRSAMTGAITGWLYGGLTLELSPTSKGVDAGSSVNFTFVIRNHGVSNKTVRDLSVSSMPAGWSADITPKVSAGKPITNISGFQKLSGQLRVRSPVDAPPNAKATAVLTLVVDETGEVLKNSTTAVVRTTPRLNISVSPDGQQAEAGKNASYLLTIKNTGNIRTSINLSANGTIQTWASFETAFLILDPGQEDTVVLTLTVPINAPAGNGSMSVLAEGRYQGTITRASTSVNITVKQFRMLQISNVRAADGGRVDPNAPRVEVFVELDNRGNGNDRVKITLSGTFIGQENWGWDEKTVNIPAFDRGFKTNLTLIVWDKAQGATYNVTVVALSEDGKTTAYGFILITVLRPDLFLNQEGVVLDYDLVVGQATTFGVKIFNGGLVDSLAPNVTVYDRSHDVIFTGKASSSVKAGGFIEMDVEWTPQYKGPDELTFVVNDGKAIIESAYENNSITRSITVYQPNLKIEESDILFYVEGKETTKVTAGQLVSITVQVRNMDAYTYKSQDVLVEFFMDGQMIANKTIDVILANNIKYVRTEWKATTGSHTILIKVDPDNDIKEQDENDNQVSVVLKVKAKPAGPITVSPLLVGGAIIAGVVLLVAYGMARGVIGSPLRKSRVEFAEKDYRCNECKKPIKKGMRYYHCTCGARAHVKCAKRAELCECLRRVRIDEK